MTRYYLDCRDHPSATKCSVAMGADTKEELLEAAVQHGAKVHGHTDTPEYREEMLKQMKEGTPTA